MSDNLPNKRYLDSTKPDAVPVSHTSKPSIVKNKQVSHDPMMLESGLEDEPETKLLEAKKSDNKPVVNSLLLQNTSNENGHDLPTVLQKSNNQPKLQPIKSDSESQTKINSGVEPTKSTETGKTSESPSLSVDLSASSSNQSNEIDLPKDVIENKLPQSDAINDDVKEAINKKTYNLPIKSAKSKTVKIFIGLIIVAVFIICFVIITFNK